MSFLGNGSGRGWRSPTRQTAHSSRLTQPRRRLAHALRRGGRGLARPAWRARHDAVRCGMRRRGAVRRGGAVRWGAARHGAPWHSNGVARRGVARRRVAWRSGGWHGMAQHGPDSPGEGAHTCSRFWRWPGWAGRPKPRPGTGTSTATAGWYHVPPRARPRLFLIYTQKSPSPASRSPWQASWQPGSGKGGRLGTGMGTGMGWAPVPTPLCTHVRPNRTPVPWGTPAPLNPCTPSWQSPSAPTCAPHPGSPRLRTLG